MHRALDGDGPLPFEHYIGWLSREFGGATPSVIWAERQRLPAGFLEQVIEYRRYAEAKQAYAQNPKAEGALVDLVKVIEFELAQGEIDDAE